VHDLRRTVGSWLAQGGTTLHLIRDVLNHFDPKTTAGYAYFQMQQRRDLLTQHANKALAYVPGQSKVVVEPRRLLSSTRTSSIVTNRNVNTVVVLPSSATSRKS
jgi:hypothetical protein